MHVYVYIDVCVEYVYIACICIYRCVHVYVYIDVCVEYDTTKQYTCGLQYTNIYIYVCVCVYMYIYVCVCTYVCIYKYLCIYIYIYMPTYNFLMIRYGETLVGDFRLAI